MINFTLRYKQYLLTFLTHQETRVMTFYYLFYFGLAFGSSCVSRVSHDYNLNLFAGPRGQHAIVHCVLHGRTFTQITIVVDDD